MTKKRILTIATTLIMVLLLTAGLMACGKKDSDKTDNETSNQVTEVATDNNATPTETVIPTPTDVPTTSFEVIEGEDGEQEVIISDVTEDDVTTNENGDTVVIIDDVEVKVETNENGDVVVKDDAVSEAVKDTVNNQESDKDSDGKETGKVEVVIGKDENGEVAVSTPTPSPTATPTPTKAPVATKTPTPVVTKAPTNTATPTKQVTATPTVKATSTPTPVATKAPVPTVTKAPTATPTKKPTVTPTKAPTKAPTATPTPKATVITYEDIVFDTDLLNKLDTSKWNQYLADEINAYRVENGLSALPIHADVQAGSEIRSEELLTLHSHTRPNGEGCFTAISVENGVNGEIINRCYYIAPDENEVFNTWYEVSVCIGKKTAEALVNSWANSSAHKAIMLSAGNDYMECSVAIETATLKVYAQAFFGVE